MQYEGNEKGDLGQLTTGTGKKDAESRDKVKYNSLGIIRRLSHYILKRS